MANKDVKYKVKEYFFLNPTIRLRVRQIERKLKVSLPSVIRYTKELEKEGVLKTTDIAGVRTYSADRVSKTYLTEKKLFNIHQIIASGLLDFITAELSNPLVVVFGSYREGEDVEKSDIDIYIQTPSKKLIDLDRFKKKLQREIQLFIYRDIREVENKELANNIINGVRINGFLEVFR